MFLCKHTVAADCRALLVAHTAGPPTAMRRHRSHFDRAAPLNSVFEVTAPLIGTPNGCNTRGWGLGLGSFALCHPLLPALEDTIVIASTKARKPAHFVMLYLDWLTNNYIRRLLYWACNSRT